ncbi:MAG: NADH-quinone oxidoreductase subunit NuoG [Anaerolineales bacterium]
MEVLVNVTIDGQQVSVRAGTTVLDAAKQLGIPIPTFCYYAKLVGIGACRMCLVEVEKMRGLQTACTTKVQEGMVVHTNTPEVVKTRQGVLEFLLTNHPLDCPICDKGGECDLQDQVFQFGGTVSRFVEEKRHKAKAKPLGPFVMKDEERCVLCRRCIRFLEEWPGDPELDAFERGRNTVVDTFYGRPLTSPFSGNVIDLCPVGALTSIPFRFRARSWELKRTPSICTLCGVGCNLTLDAKANRLLRAVGRENPDVNDEWLCDRGRFGQDYVRSDQRLKTPLIRKDGQLQPATWDEALAFAARRIQDIAQTANPDVVAAVGSARASNEANYLLQKWARAAVGTNNVDFAGRPADGFAPLSSVTAPLRAGVVVLLGVDPLGDAPMVDLWIRRAALTKGTRVVAIGPKRPVVSRYGVWLGCRPGTESAVLAALLHLLARDERVQVPAKADLATWTKDHAPDRVAEATGVSIQALKQAADFLAAKGSPLVLYGSGAALSPVRDLVALLGGEAGYLAPQPNAWGALLMGVAPDRCPGGLSVEDAKARDSFGKRWDARLSPRKGLALDQMLAGCREGLVQAMLVVESDLVREHPAAAEALRTLRFLVVVDQFLTATAELADVVLPSAAPSETDGTFLNLTRRLQRAAQAAYPPKGVRPAWKVIADLADAAQGKDKKRGAESRWDYETAAEIWREITRGVAVCRECTYETIGTAGWQPESAAEKVKPAPFAVEYPVAPEGYPLTLATGRALFPNATPARYSPALAPVLWGDVLLVHPKDAEGRGIKTGDAVRVASARGAVELQARVTDEVAPGCVWACTESVAALLEAPDRATHVKLSRA